MEGIGKGWKVEGGMMLSDRELATAMETSVRYKGRHSVGTWKVSEPERRIAEAQEQAAYKEVSKWIIANRSTDPITFTNSILWLTSRLARGEMPKEANRD